MNERRSTKPVLAAITGPLGFCKSDPSHDLATLTDSPQPLATDLALSSSRAPSNVPLLCCHNGSTKYLPRKALTGKPLVYLQPCLRYKPGRQA